MIRHIVCLLLTAALPACAAGLRAGAARVDITPEGPIWMSGYASRNHPSEGVRQRLYTRALAIDGAGGKVVIVTADVVGIPAELGDAVAARAGRQFGIERARLVLNASHTHTGPVVWPNLSMMWDLPEGERQKLRDYAARLQDAMVEAIGKAVAGLGPAQLTLGFGEAGFAVNRRQYTPRGVVIGVNPDGPVDHQVPVIKIAGADGKVRGVLFAYACHNTTLTGEFYELSGDYAGAAEAQLESDYPGSVALFLQLCAGDQNPNPRSKPELAVEHGRALAAEVRRVMEGGMVPLHAPVRAAWVVTRLRFAPQPRSVYEADLANPKASPALRNRARKMLDSPVSDTAYPVQALRFGKDLTLLALGGEVVVDYDLRAKREYPGEPLIVAAYSNSVMGYIPSERVLKEGGYEAVDNLIYYGQPGPFAPGVEDAVFAAIHQAMKEVGRR
ncbi:MAG: neutral/alkaline non-lysosomal ceramidase N-terminal domain-containing protein [Acidobacteriota bacterium]|nr:neutral/alkaline non-lysosomal ceramidase N-terminal domain-containing protein [Acidobacteriota bacterium]